MTNVLLDLLRAERLLDEGSLRAAVDRSLKTGEDLASAVQVMKLLPERTLVRLLARAHGYPGIDLSHSVVKLANLELVPEDVARRKLVLPVLDTGAELVVAMANPDDAGLYDQLRFLTGRKVLRHVAVASALKVAVERAFYGRSVGDSEWRGKEMWNSNPPPEGRAEVVHPYESGAAPPASRSSSELPLVIGNELELQLEDELAASPWLDTMFEQGELPSPPKAKAAAAAPLDGTSDVATLKVDAVGAGKTVLAVDDDVDMRGLEAKLLKPFGCAVVETGDGREAIQLCRDVRPDLLILDAMLPGMNGFEVCRAIKGDPELRKTGIIMVSGIYTGWKIGVDVKDVYGADYFFEKPFRVEEVSRAVRVLMLGGVGDEQVSKARRQQALDACREASQRAREGKLPEAIALLQAAAQKDPFSAEPHFFLGQVLKKAKRPYDAVAALEQAADLRPDLDQPLALLGDLYLQLGFRKTAHEVLSRALLVCADPARTEDLKKRLAAL